VGLGVDGVASNEIGGLFPEMRMALFLARQRDLSSTTFVPADALRLATEDGARCLGRDDVGRLEPGFKADVVVWPGDDLGDVLDPLAGLILGPERYARHVFVEGEYVVRGTWPAGPAGSGRKASADGHRRGTQLRWFNELFKKEAVVPDAARTGPDDAVH
jgi:cytosine/adenosine deaminase-related metal-dependent hydrolase